MGTKSQIAILSVVFSLLAIFGITAYSWTDPQKTALGATFALYADRGEDGAQFRCTATAFERSITGGYYLLTAGHCILHEADAQFSVAEEIGAPRTEVRVIKYRVDSLLDFAILDLETKKVYPTIPLGSDAGVGTQIVNPNFGFGLIKQLSLGTVSSERLSKVADCDNCESKFMVQVFGAPGSSGSAVIANGKIAGIITNEFTGINVGLAGEPISAFPSFLDSPVQEKLHEDAPKSIIVF